MYYSDTLSPFIKAILNDFPFGPTGDQKECLKKLRKLLKKPPVYDLPNGEFVLDQQGLPVSYLFFNEQTYEQRFFRELKKEDQSATKRKKQEKQFNKRISCFKKYGKDKFCWEYNFRREKIGLTPTAIIERSNTFPESVLEELDELQLAIQVIVRHISFLEIKAEVYRKSEFQSGLTQPSAALNADRTKKIGCWLKKKKDKFPPTHDEYRTLGYRSLDELFFDAGEVIGREKGTARGALVITKVHINGQKGKNSVDSGSLELTISNCIKFCEKA